MFARMDVETYRPLCFKPHPHAVFFTKLNLTYVFVFEHENVSFL